MKVEGPSSLPGLRETQIKGTGPGSCVETEAETLSQCDVKNYDKTTGRVSLNEESNWSDVDVFCKYSRHFREKAETELKHICFKLSFIYLKFSERVPSTLCPLDTYPRKLNIKPNTCYQLTNQVCGNEATAIKY